LTNLKSTSLNLLYEEILHAKKNLRNCGIPERLMLGGPECWDLPAGDSCRSAVQIVLCTNQGRKKEGVITVLLPVSIFYKP
jgi:hypothetical protein